MDNNKFNKLTFAKFFAAYRHQGQTYGFLPYTHHLQEVEMVLRRFNVNDEDMFCAAWLHDVVEDTTTKKRDIYECFGDRVGDLVWAVTDEPGEDRESAKARTYPKTRACLGAVTLKLADRIANVENGGNSVDKYKKEQESFRRNLYTEGVSEDMWKHLEWLLKDGLK